VAGRAGALPHTLVCPGCGARRPAHERFCADCRLPLVLDPGSARSRPLSERHRQARKVKPQLTEGALVKVAWARNQTEGEFIQGMLLEEGVPSMLRRSAGFDVPDFLAAGPRDVMVPISGRDIARQVLLQADIVGDEAPGDGALGVVAPRRLLIGIVIALALGALVIWLISLAVSG
jgi:hypothetical protein